MTVGPTVRDSPPVAGRLLSRACVVDITPSGPVTLGGATDTVTPVTDVSESLEANIALLRDDTDEATLFVTLDLLYAGREIRKAVESAARLPPERVWVAASHSHNAPLTDQTKPGLGLVDSRYVAEVCERIGDAVSGLAQGLQSESPVSLKLGTGTLDHSVNRRRRAGRPGRERVILAPNPAGPRDEVVSVLVAEGADRPEFVAWNYACHPVAYPCRRCVSSHFPGVVREALRKDLGIPDLPVLFFQGFSGDTRPSRTSRMSGPTDLVRRGMKGRTFYPMSRTAFQTWSGGIARSIVEMVSSATEIHAAGVASRRVERELQDFATSARPRDPVSFQAADLGEVCFVGMSGEVVSNYAHWLRSRLRGKAVFCVGCLDEPFGYVPTGRMLQEGGYEANDFCQAFGLGKVQPGIESVVKEQFSVMLSSLGGE